MFDHDPLGLWLATSVAIGIAGHSVVATRRCRRNHRVDRLQSQWAWSDGLGRHVRLALVACAVVGLAGAILTHRIPPVFAGAAALLVIGLRRLLIVTVLMLSVFAAVRLAGPVARSHVPGGGRPVMARP